MDSIKINQSAPSFQAKYRPIRNNNYQQTTSKDPNDRNGRLMLSLVAIGSCALATCALAAAGKVKSIEKAAQGASDTKPGFFNFIRRGANEDGSANTRGIFSKLKNSFSNVGHKNKAVPVENIDISSGLARTPKGKVFTGFTQSVDEATGEIKKHFYKKGKLINSEVILNDKVIQRNIHSKGIVQKIFCNNDGAFERAEIVDKDGNIIKRIEQCFDNQNRPISNNVKIREYLPDDIIKTTTGEINTKKHKTILDIEPKDITFKQSREVGYYDITGTNKLYSIDVDGGNYRVSNITDAGEDFIVINLIDDNNKIVFSRNTDTGFTRCIYNKKSNTFDGLEEFKQDMDEDKFTTLFNELKAEMNDCGLKKTPKFIDKIFNKICS